MSNKIMSVALAVLLLTNLYSLKNYFELKSVISRNQTWTETLSNAPENDLSNSIERLSSIIQEQQILFSQMTHKAKEGWSMAKDQATDIQGRFQKLEKDLEDLKQMKNNLFDEWSSDGKKN